MDYEHEIVSQVYAAKENHQAADRLLNQYLPFIKSETAKYLHRSPVEGEDDEFSIALLAFHEAIRSYQKMKGAFLPFAARIIRSRLIDYSRKERRHTGVLSLHEYEDHNDESQPIINQVCNGQDELSEHTQLTAAKEEILEFSNTLKLYGLSLPDIADNSPKQTRTLAACHQALRYAKENPKVFQNLTETKKLPIALLVSGSGVERKTIERHRKYMLAILLAYTNGFEIIRGHLNQISFQKGGRQ